MRNSRVTDDGDAGGDGMINFLGQEIETGKCYVYLKTIRTGS